MKTILFIIQKEFKQIFRDKSMLRLIFILPILQLLILSNAATFDVKNIRVTLADYSNSSSSRALIEKFKANAYFSQVENVSNTNEGIERLNKGTTDVVIEIPNQFEKQLQNDNATQIQVLINAIDGATAGVQNVYITQIVQLFNQNIQVENKQMSNEQIIPNRIETIPSFWYNSTLNYKTFMVPGILVLLVTMLTLFLSAMNIVREKELGTLEQINVTPIKKHQFIRNYLCENQKRCRRFILLFKNKKVTKCRFFSRRIIHQRKASETRKMVEKQPKCIDFNQRLRNGD